MGIRDLFNVRRAPPSAGPLRGTGGGGEPPTTQGAFVTPQSLTSFLGASGVTALIWKIAGLLFPAWANSLWAAFFCALFVGAVLFFISETDPARGPISKRQYAIDAIVGALNVLVLFSAAIGGTAAVSNAGGQNGVPPVVENRTM